MTVRFKSEYQKSYGVSRSRSVSPQRRYLLVGLPSAQMASRSSSAHKNRRSTKPRPEEVSESPSRPEPGSTSRRETDGKPAKLRPPEPGGTATAERRPGGQRSEYHRQFGWKEPVSAASPLLTAEQVLYSSSRSVPPFKKNPVPMETEYRRRRRQTEPLFHTYSIHRRKSLEPHTKPQVGHKTTKDDNRSLSPPRDGPRPAQVPRRRRNPEEGGGADGLNEQVKELRRQALAYRRRAWGTNFSRNHLSQLLSEHNVLWELSDTTDSHSEPPTPPPSAGASPEAHGRATSSVEALDLASICSRTSSAGGKTPGDAGRETSPGPERQTAWGEEEETDE